MEKLSIILALALILSPKCNAQSKNFKIPDSLQNKSINYLKNRVDADYSVAKKDSIYLYSYLAKAKSSNDYENVINAYSKIMHRSKKENRLKYCDSMQIVAEKSKDNELIGTAYLDRGVVYYSFKQYSKALDNFILADKFISTTENQYLKYKTKYSIAQIKYYLGYYNESISLLKDCEKYFKENETGKPYLRTLHSLGLCYIKTEKYDLATATNELGYREAIDLDEPSTIPYFINSDGRIEYFKKNYHLAIEKLQKSMPTIVAAKDFANVSATNFYIGRSYWALGEKQKAIPFLKKVDEIFKKENFIKEDLLEAYDLIAKYYEEKENLNYQLKYLTALLEAETFVTKNFMHISKNMHRKYDLKKIEEETEDLKRQLFFKEKMNLILGVLFLIIVTSTVFIIFRQYQQRKQRKQKFKTIISNKNPIGPPISANKKIVDGDLIIKPEIVEAVSQKLEKLEQSNLYLDKDFTLNKMAAFVDCNTRYTSRIIFETRKKKYIEYVDDLRIDYIVNQLKTNSKFRNYTIKALTEEAGFKSPQKFKDAFLKSTGLTPIYFIQQLKKQPEQ